jgi:hypothetical protein
MLRMEKINYFAGHLLLLGVAVWGCGGGDDTSTCSGALCGGTPAGGGGAAGSGTCSAVAPCGGSLDGTWQVDGVCVEGDLAAVMLAQQNLPAACHDLFQSVTPTMTGTVTFADGMETDNFSQTVGASVLFTEACMSADVGYAVIISAATCTSVGPYLVSNQQFSTATCSLAGSNCACSVSQRSQSPTTPQAYVVSGNTVTYSGGGSSMDYCVSGTTLTAREVESGVTFVTTLHKL